MIPIEEYLKEQCESLGIPVPWIGNNCENHELSDHYCREGGIFIAVNSDEAVADHELLHYIFDLVRMGKIDRGVEEDICEFFGDSVWYGRTVDLRKGNNET